MSNTPCIRCGKTRIIGKSWNEYIDKSLITYTLTVCPDPECQKIVDRQIKSREKEFITMHRESLKRRENTRNNKAKRLKTA